MTKAEAGRLGGLSTRQRHGSEFYRTVGSKGGRPRLPTIDEILRRSEPQPFQKQKEGMITDAPGGNLLELKRLWRVRRSTGASNNAEGPA